MPKIHSFSTHTFYFSFWGGLWGCGGQVRWGPFNNVPTENIKDTHLPRVPTYISYLLTYLGYLSTYINVEIRRHFSLDTQTIRNEEAKIQVDCKDAW
jgi:hypothetical protein